MHRVRTPPFLARHRSANAWMAGQDRTVRVKNRLVLARPDIVRHLILAELGGK
jgi:hypothetical protein